jgi:hypothetical protein
VVLRQELHLTNHPLPQDFPKELQGLLQLVFVLQLVHLILLKGYQVLKNLGLELPLQLVEQLESLKPKLTTLVIMTNLDRQEQLQQVLEVVVAQVQPSP